MRDCMRKRWMYSRLDASCGGAACITTKISTGRKSSAPAPTQACSRTPGRQPTGRHRTGQQLGARVAAARILPVLLPPAYCHPRLAGPPLLARHSTPAWLQGQTLAVGRAQLLLPGELTGCSTPGSWAGEWVWRSPRASPAATAACSRLLITRQQFRMHTSLSRGACVQRPTALGIVFQDRQTQAAYLRKS